jgi:hypothetical protein
VRVGVGVGRGVREAVAVGVGVGAGVGAGVGVTSATVVGDAGAIDARDGDTTASGADAPSDPVGPMVIAPPRANTNATDAVNAMTSTTSDPSIAGDIARPRRTTGVGVSVITAAPRR